VQSNLPVSCDVIGRHIIALLVSATLASQIERDYVTTILLSAFALPGSERSLEQFIYHVFYNTSTDRTAGTSAERCFEDRI
jgi:hypothetical protein